MTAQERLTEEYTPEGDSTYTFIFKDTDGKEIRVQREIDFIASLGSKKYYIQSAYAIPSQEKYEQETLSFEHTMDSFKKIIIVEKSMKPRYDENGYLMMGVKEFLLDANSLLI